MLWSVGAQHGGAPHQSTTHSFNPAAGLDDSMAPEKARCRRPRQSARLFRATLLRNALFSRLPTASYERTPTQRFHQSVARACGDFQDTQLMPAKAPTLFSSGPAARVKLVHLCTLRSPHPRTPHSALGQPRARACSFSASPPPPQRSSIVSPQRMELWQPAPGMIAGGRLAPRQRLPGAPVRHWMLGLLPMKLQFLSRPCRIESTERAPAPLPLRAWPQPHHPSYLHVYSARLPPHFRSLPMRQARPQRRPQRWSPPRRTVLCSSVVVKPTVADPLPPSKRLMRPSGLGSGAA
jgi:hypothetical protein